MPKTQTTPADARRLEADYLDALGPVFLARSALLGAETALEAAETALKAAGLGTPVVAGGVEEPAVAAREAKSRATLLRQEAAGAGA